jgi:hypothetical protein
MRYVLQSSTDYSDRSLAKEKGFDEADRVIDRY